MLGDGYELNVADQTTLLPLTHIQDFAEAIFQMTWTWMEAPEGIDFITGDSPAIREVPPKYLHRYNGGFRRRFFATFLTVGYKLAQPDPLVPGLGVQALPYHHRHMRIPGGKDRPV